MVYCHFGIGGGGGELCLRYLSGTLNPPSPPPRAHGGHRRALRQAPHPHRLPTPPAPAAGPGGPRRVPRRLFPPSCRAQGGAAAVGSDAAASAAVFRHQARAGPSPARAACRHSSTHRAPWCGLGGTAERVDGSAGPRQRERCTGPEDAVRRRGRRRRPRGGCPAGGGVSSSLISQAGWG